jgi:alpha-tubulin suppressor-like RCC1 family protein
VGPVRVLGNAHAIATGAAHTCAIDGETTVRCWGSNSAGQLGDGTFANRLAPVTVIR